MKHQGVFIGLGGAGVCATAHLKARLLRDAGSREALSEHCRFIFIDTDTNAYNRMNDLYFKDFGNRNLIESDWVPFSSVSPLNLYRKAVGKKLDNNLDAGMKILLSFVDERSASSFKPVTLEEGASANRQQGRVAIWSQWRIVQRKINACIEGLKNPKNAQQSVQSIPFYILSGTCGGTGSSMFLDVAYLVDRTVKSHFKDREPTVRAVLFMPEWYIQLYKKNSSEDIVRKYQCNAYAFFEELNYFLADYHAGEQAFRGRGFEKIFVAPAIDEQVESYNKKWGVFNFAICIDSTSEHETKFNDEQMYRNTAELLYHWHQAEVQGSVVSSFDNQLRDNYLATERVPAFVTLGYRALEYPGDLAEKYLTTRFQYEFFKYGLLGDRADVSTYLNTAEGSNWLGRIVDTELKPYLSSRLEEGSRNLFNNTTAVIDQGVSAFRYPSNELSIGQKLRKTFQETIHWTTNSSYDFSRVGNPDTVDQFRGDAEREIAAIGPRMTTVFTNPASELSLLQLAEKCRGVIEKALEDAFMAFGLNGARAVAAELQSRLGEFRFTCRANEQEHVAELTRLEESISGARKSCLERKDDNSLSKLRELFEKRLSATYRMQLARQQSQLLDHVAGREGLLLRYHKNLKSMNSSVTKRFAGTNEDDQSIKDSFEDMLAMNSSLTYNTVTTTYVPTVDDIRIEGRLNLSHPFAKTYNQLVPRNTQGGPLGRSLSGDIWTQPVGMHSLMIEMLMTGEAYGDNGSQPQTESLFRKYLKSPDEHSQMVREFDERGKSMILRLRDNERSTNGSNIESAFEQLSLIDKEKIKDQFVNQTGTFCRMDASMRSKPLDVRLYVGQSERLAAAMGYQEGAESRFIRTTEGDDLLYLTAKALWSIDQYPFYEQYRRIYQAQQQRLKNGNNVLFSPHIHRLFNDLGVQDGMRRLSRPGVNHDLFILSLLYDELFRISKEQFFPLFDRVVFWDPKYQGDQATQLSPLEVFEENGERGVRVIEKVDTKDDKLLFTKENFTVVVKPYNNFKSFFEKLEAESSHVFIELNQIDDFVRQNCSREWAVDDGPLNQAFRCVDEKFNIPSGKGRPIAADITNWYARMQIRLREIYHDLAAELSTRTKSKAPYKGSSDEDYEPILNV